MFQRAHGQTDTNSLANKIIDIFQASSEDEALDIILKHPEVLTDKAIAMAERMIDHVSNQSGFVVDLLQRYELLLGCKSEGTKRVKARNYFNAGTMYLKQGRAQDSIWQFQEALRIDPDYAEAHFNLGAAYGQIGRARDEIAEYQKAKCLTPNDEEIYYNLGLTYEAQGQLGDAIHEYSALLRMNPNHAAAHHSLAVCYFRQGHLDQALPEAQVAVRLGSDARSLIAEIQRYKSSRR